MSNKTTLLGLCGLKQSGKDTVYKLIQEEFVNTQRIAFADPLKEELATACGVSVEFINTHKEAFRGGVCWWGTEFRRSLYGREYWVLKAHERYLFWLNQGADLVVVTDVRFPNEAAYVRSQGGVLWSVQRRLSWWNRFRSSNVHSSEHWNHHNSKEVDVVVRNNGTVEDLRREVRRELQFCSAFNHVQRKQA
jgi:hypothetical protein